MTDSSLGVIRIGLIGFGAVGRSFCEILTKKLPVLHLQYRVDVRVVGIATLTHGCVSAVEAALDLAACLAAPDGALALVAGTREHGSALELLEALEGRCDVVVECINASHEDGEPAVSILRKGLLMNPPCHIVTASKPPVALAYEELKAAAEERGRRFLFESSVMDGCPIFSALRQLPALTITRISGILNSTTNIILTRMEETGCSLDDALAEAQRQGIAEREPEDDIDGWDAATKLCVLATVIFGERTHPRDVPKESIRSVTPKLVKEVAMRDARLKVVCTIAREDAGLSLAVEVKELALLDPLSSVKGASSAVTFESDLMGPITIIQTEPTVSDTGYGLLQDIMNAALGDGRALSTLSSS